MVMLCPPGQNCLVVSIIKHYELPHTISVVEAEMYTPDRQERMEKTARDLFALDYVEIATHTYSHPFHWQRLRKGSPSGEHNLSIPEYRFDLDREIGGSATYIDTNLAPQGKKTTVLLWSGDAIPLADALATADKYGLINMNGGNTVISKSLPTVSAISANVRTVGGWTQIYAPIMNENVFTNEWLGPFDGFRRVIETLEMTEHPRRIKPANVYYHFYAGTKKASLRSLEEIYDWSMQQDILPVLSSVYILKVPNFRTAGVARHLDGRWKVSGLGTIKSLRTLKKNSFPDLGSTQSLIGTRETHDATYIHTNGANTVTFRMNSSKPQQIHLVAANALVKRWERRSDNTISMRLTGDLPVSIELGGDLSGCDFTAHGKTIRGKSTPLAMPLSTVKRESLIPRIHLLSIALLLIIAFVALIPSRDTFKYTPADTTDDKGIDSLDIAYLKARDASGDLSEEEMLAVIHNMIRSKKWRQARTLMAQRPDIVLDPRDQFLLNVETASAGFYGAENEARSASYKAELINLMQGLYDTPVLHDEGTLTQAAEFSADLEQPDLSSSYYILMAETFPAKAAINYNLCGRTLQRFGKYGGAADCYQNAVATAEDPVKRNEQQTQRLKKWSVKFLRTLEHLRELPNSHWKLKDPTSPTRCMHKWPMSTVAEQSSGLKKQPCGQKLPTSRVLQPSTYCQFAT